MYIYIYIGTIYGPYKYIYIYTYEPYMGVMYMNIYILYICGPYMVRIYKYIKKNTYIYIYKNKYRIWSLHIKTIYGHYIKGPYIVFIYIQRPYMVIIYNDHICSLYIYI